MASLVPKHHTPHLQVGLHRLQAFWGRRARLVFFDQAGLQGLPSVRARKALVGQERVNLLDLLGIASGESKPGGFGRSKRVGIFVRPSVGLLMCLIHFDQMVC